MSVSRSKLVALITSHSQTSLRRRPRAVYMVPCAETIDVLEATETSPVSWLGSNWKPHGVPQRDSPPLSQMREYQRYLSFRYCFREFANN